MALLEGPIVVGVDGAAQIASSVAAAVELGAWEAGRHGVALHLVGCFETPRPWDRAAAGETHRDAARRHLDAMFDTASAAHPAVTITTGLHQASAGNILVAASTTASLVIVCADARVHYGGLQAGLVSAQVVAHARAPVIVVPNPGSGQHRAGPALVVVGIDGSSECADAIAFAFDEADARHGGLLAVHASNLSPIVGEVADHPDHDGARTADLMLYEATEGWQQKYPNVLVSHRIINSINPVRAISDAAVNADLIVVGARGGGGFAELALGSVSDGLVRYARTAVAVVRGFPPAPATSRS